MGEVLKGHIVVSGNFTLCGLTVKPAMELFRTIKGLMVCKNPCKRCIEIAGRK